MIREMYWINKLQRKLLKVANHCIRLGLMVRVIKVKVWIEGKTGNRVKYY
jgi:hypothetical protein